MRTTGKSFVCLSSGLILTICFMFTALAQMPPPTNRLETGGQYDIKPPPSNMMFQVTDNPTNAGDDNLVWSFSGRMLAVDRSDPTATNMMAGNKYVCLLDVRDLGNIQVIGARSSAATNPLFANITSWTYNDDRILFGWQPQSPGNPPPPAGKCRLMSCASGSGPMDVQPFLKSDPQNNPTNHLYSPSVIYDPAAGKERLLFCVSTYQGAGQPTDASDPSTRINLYTVTYASGGVPGWGDRVPLTAFNTNLSIQSAKWCPELGTNYQPICNRLEMLISIPAPMPGEQQAEENSRIFIFNDVRSVMEGTTLPPTSLDDPRLVLLETNMTMNSQVSWTFDGQYVMYGRMVNNPPAPPATDIYSKRTDSPTNTAVKFEVPSSIQGGQKQWLCISPDGMKAAFTVDHKVYVIPLQFDNVAVTGAVLTNVLTDASYTAIDVPGDAIPSNTTFSIVAPPVVDTNNFNGEYSGYAREISASGVSSQLNLLTNATMTLHFSDADIPSNASMTNIAIYVYNPEGTEGQTGTWDKLESVVDTNAHTISAEVQHFSVYAIGQASVQPVRTVLADPAIVDSMGNWYVWFSGSGYQRGGPWNLGVAGTPLAADFDGDLYSDCAIVDSTGAWRVWFTSQGYRMGGPWNLGVSGTPVAADFDGDLYGDPAMVDATGAWRVWFTSQGYQMGGPWNLGVTGLPVAADYDGDWYADPAVVDSTGAWRVWFTSYGYQMSGPFSLGIIGLPVPADFDGR